MPAFGNPHRFFKRILFFICALAVLTPLFGVASASENVRPVGAGEAFMTRFSGVVETSDKAGRKSSVLDINGVVGSVVDIRNPLAKAMGQHWRDENQRFEVLASEVGQVFGIAYDNASPPNIYVSATSAFGLHRNGDNSDWAPGMWGAGGNAGTVYKLNARKNYAPEIFAQVKLGERENSGPALGNLAFDGARQQLFVSDLETGMIHRFDIKTGKDLGHFDHGVTGRSRFLDRKTGELMRLKPEHFKADCFAQLKDCDGAFAQTPSCWNFASANRRVWGLDVRTMPDGSRRLFYATWGSVDGVSKVSGVGGKNWIWSVALDDDGGFALDDVAREFALPALVVDEKIAFSAPSDLSFSRTGALLIGERGAPRNYLGMYQSAFARPTISRSFEYVLGVDGLWKMVGQYDVGNRPVSSGASRDRFDNSAGGVAWGFGYDKFGKIDLKSRDQFVWLSGDSLCSNNGACFDFDSLDFDDRDHVVGIEGRNKGYFRGNVDRSYKIDSDINVLKNGQIILRQALKNDDSQGAGDVEIYQGKSQEPSVENKAVPPVVKFEIPKTRNNGSPNFKKPSEYKIPLPVITAPKINETDRAIIKSPQAFKNVPYTVTPKRIKPETVVPKKIVPKKVVPKKVVPKKVVPKRSVPKKVVAPIVSPKTKPVLKQRVKKSVAKKKVIVKKRLKKRIKKRAERRIVKRSVKRTAKRAVKRKVRKRVKRKQVRKKLRRRGVPKTHKKNRVKCNCDCNCEQLRPKKRGPKRILHPGGNADYSGAGKVKLFVPRKP